MTTKTIKKTTAAHRSTDVAHARQPSAYQRLDELLHTMRCIAQYEDRLCELSHELKRGVGVSAEISEEVREILDKVPSHDYVLDLDAVREALVEATAVTTTTTTKVAAKKAASFRKKSAVAKKATRKIGRTSSR